MRKIFIFEKNNEALNVTDDDDIGFFEEFI